MDRRAPIYSVLDGRRGSPIADWRAVAGTDRGDRRQDHRSVVIHSGGDLTVGGWLGMPSVGALRGLGDGLTRRCLGGVGGEREW